MSRLRFADAAVLATIAVALLWGGCSTGSDAPNYTNPLDPGVGEGLPVPEAVVVRVGDGRVDLSWSLPKGETADQFAVYRKRVDVEPAESEKLLGKVDQASYTDLAVRNGRTYAYRLAAGMHGQFGSRTEEIEARPGLYAILLENDKKVTSSLQVSVTLNGADATSVRLSEDPDVSTGQWRAADASVSWTLPPGDGPKTLYARFRLSNGAETEIVSDSIELDTKAVVHAVEFVGSSVRSPGESVHFRISAGELGGSAKVTIEGVFSGVELLDDGTNGDATRSDGVYERDLVLPAGSSATEAAVKGDFTDLAGNAAAQSTATSTFSVHRRPDPISVVSAIVSEPPDAPSVAVRWTRSLESQFSQYRLFRAETAAVDSLSELVHTGTDAGTVDYTDSDVYEGQTLYYRAYVRNQVGLEAPSNVLRVTLPNVRPPAAGNIQTPLDTGTLRISVRWDKSAERDFASYRLYRNEDGAVSDQDLLVTEIDDPDLTFWDDSGLQENTKYYYRLYTIDLAGLLSRSGEVEGKTKNDPPAAVTLHAATDVDTTSLTLSWEESTAHDFETYGLYRDKIATVTTGSSLVVKLDDASFTSFRDTKLEIGAQYYYRVFVFDDAEEHAGSNTITVTTADTTGGGTP